MKRASDILNGAGSVRKGWNLKQKLIIGNNFCLLGRVGTVVKFNRRDRKIFIKKNVLSFFGVDACIRSVYCPVYWVTDRFAYEMSRMIIRIENIYIYIG